MAACAVYALAMVFSVQQGEHGPLVVYKLQVPAAEAPAPYAPTYVIPSRAPAVLGTVVLPAERAPRVAEPLGDVLTLQQINDDIAWRRDTVEKLRQVPIAPRF